MFRRKIPLCGNYDVLSLCETLLKKSDSISVPGYRFIDNNRSVLHRNTRRGSGGCYHWPKRHIEINREGLKPLNDN
jgi:hypothetical protein